MERREFLKNSLLASAIPGLVAGTMAAEGCAESKPQNVETPEETKLPVVFFTRKITPENLVEIYERLGRKLPGKVAVKVHSGEPGGKHFVQPEFMKLLVEAVQGTFVECNTAYPGRRDTTEEHLQVLEEHGFTKIAPVDLLDAEGEMELPIPTGKQIQVNYVGDHLKRYDSMLVLSHFKGHLMGGFGGALKNMSIGIASSHGKAYIHGAGFPEQMWDCEQDKFLEAMADADRSIVDFFPNKMAFINVMKDLSVDCDCDSSPHAPEMADIGILASLDPVALDQACVDLVYQSSDKGKASLIERMESRHAVHILEAAEELGIGSRKYRLEMI